MKYYHMMVGVFFILIASGCAGSTGKAFTGEKFDAKAIFSNIVCEGLDRQSGATWIENETEFISIINKIKGQRIGGSTMPIPTIDFKHEGVLLIQMGRKSTGGYRIELALDNFYIRDNTAFVTIRWIEPEKDAVLTQVITSPCIMVKLAKGGYTRIEVADQNGIVRAETALDR
jgi:hypothetical protein